MSDAEPAANLMGMSWAPIEGQTARRSHLAGQAAVNLHSRRVGAMWLSAVIVKNPPSQEPTAAKST